jgi:hypothetical protein
MSSRLKRGDVETAKEILKIHILDRIEEDFGRLMFLASTRDHSTGTYHDIVLTSLFSKPAAALALADCHKDIFRRLAVSELQPFLSQLERYLRSVSRDRHTTVRVLENLDPSSPLIPSDCNPLMRESFLSNVRVSLEILRHRQSPCLE